jgi:hypothetical protein
LNFFVREFIGGFAFELQDTVQLSMNALGKQLKGTDCRCWLRDSD